jgi:hypothetical protein
VSLACSFSLVPALKASPSREMASLIAWSCPRPDPPTLGPPASKPLVSAPASALGLPLVSLAVHNFIVSPRSSPSWPRAAGSGSLAAGAVWPLLASGRKPSCTLTSKISHPPPFKVRSSARFSFVPSPLFSQALFWEGNFLFRLQFPPPLSLASSSQSDLVATATPIHLLPSATALCH